MTSVVSLLVASLRKGVARALGRRRLVHVERAHEPTKFVDTQDLLDDVRATGQTRGLDVRESELDQLPADVQRHFGLPSTHGRI